jgi:hypothetical protein
VEHRALYQVFLDVRDAAAKILENKTLADIMNGGSTRPNKRERKKKNSESRVLAMVPGSGNREKNG